MDRHINQVSNILLKGIGCIGLPNGDRNQYVNVRDQINTEVDRVIEDLDQKETTNHLQLTELLNAQKLIDVIEENGNAVSQVLDYVRNNINNIQAFRELGYNLDGITFGDINVLAYDTMAINKTVINRILFDIFESVENPSDNDTVLDFIYDSIINATMDKLSFSHYCKSKGIEDTEDTNALFASEFLEWRHNHITNLLASLVAGPEVSVFVAPIGVDELRETILKYIPTGTDLSTKISTVSVEELLSNSLTHTIYETMLGPNYMEMNPADIDPSVRTAIISIENAKKEFVKKNSYGSLDVPMQGMDGNPVNQVQEIQSTINLAEVILAGLINQSAKLWDSKLTEVDLVEDDVFQYLYGVYQDCINLLIPEHIRTDITAKRVMSTIAYNIQAVVFINVLTRIKDRNVTSALYTIAELIKDYINTELVKKHVLEEDTDTETTK